MNIKMINRAEKESYTFFDKRYIHPSAELTYRSDFTLMFIIHGHGTIHVNKESNHFQKSNIILIGPYTPFRIVSATDNHEIMMIVFRMQAMGEGFLNSCQLAHVRSLLERSSYGLKYTGKVCASAFSFAQKIENTFGFREVIHLFEILDILSLSGNHQILTSACFFSRHIDKNSDKIENIKKYIKEHSTESIYVEGIAKEFNMAESTFLRFFKNNTGISFIKYLNRIRIENACQLLNSSKESITTISSIVGYASLSNFYKQFSSIVEITPQQYRRKLCTDTNSVQKTKGTQ